MPLGLLFGSVETANGIVEIIGIELNGVFFTIGLAANLVNNLAILCNSE